MPVSAIFGVVVGYTGGAVQRPDNGVVVGEDDRRGAEGQVGDQAALRWTSISW
jgi:hypothetical protein